MKSLLDEITRNNATVDFQKPAPLEVNKPQADRRRIAWHRLQQASPETARFLADCTAAFGKPAALRLSVDDETIYEQGEL